MNSLAVPLEVQLSLGALALDDKVHLELVSIVKNRRERKAYQLAHVIFKFLLRELGNLLDDGARFVRSIGAGCELVNTNAGCGQFGGYVVALTLAPVNFAAYGAEVFHSIARPRHSIVDVAVCNNTNGLFLSER